MSRPHRRNALSPRLRDELLAALTTITLARRVRVGVLTGSGGHFCTGADLVELDPCDLGEEMPACNRPVFALRELPHPVTTQVQGSAVGAGFNLTLACDLVVADDSARFAQQFPKLGLSVDLGGCWILRRLVGPHRARQLALTGEEIDGQSPAAMGLINCCVPAGELVATVERITRGLVGRSPEAQARTKRLLDDAGSGSLSDARDRETKAQVANAAEPGFSHALASSRERSGTP